MRALFLLVGLAIAVPSTTIARPVPVADPTLAALRAIELPHAARALRNAGVAEGEVRVTLDAVRVHQLRAWDLVYVLDEALVATRTHGTVPNFGAFVQSRLARGLRGRALAEAIHAEHATYGMGHPSEGSNGGGHGMYDEKHAGKHVEKAAKGASKTGSGAKLTRRKDAGKLLAGKGAAKGSKGAAKGAGKEKK